LQSRLPCRETIAELSVTRIPFAGSIRYPIAPQVLAHLGKSDIVHVHAIDFFFDFLALTKPLHRKKLIATTHGGFFHTRFADRAKRLYFATATRLSTTAYERIVASSQSDADLFRRITSRVVTIEPGASVEKFANCAAKSATRTLIYFGRLAKNKRIPALIALLAELRKISPEWSLIIAGGEVEETVADLEGLARGFVVGDAVVFFESPSDADLRRLIEKASYYVSLSAYEGFGITVAEAMSAGLVPILSDIAPFREFVRRAGAGLIVDTADLAAAARAIAAFDATHPSAHRDRLIAAAAGYSWSAMTEAYAAEYARILGLP
jgi:alpha-1,3-mannosyltransferase